MSDHSILAQMRRPKLLVRAARIGLETYDPKYALPSCVKTNTQSSRLPVLIDHESELEEDRKTGAATYNVQDHVKVLTALLFEALQPPKIVS